MAKESPKDKSKSQDKKQKCQKSNEHCEQSTVHEEKVQTEFDEGIDEFQDDNVQQNEQVTEQEEKNEEELVIEHNVELEELKQKSHEYYQLAQRTLADFDNYKRRVIKEKEMLYADAVIDVVSKFLPLLDGLESALKHVEDKADEDSVIDGVKKLSKQFKETLQSIGVEEIKAVGEQFDPNYHYAVMHIQDDQYGPNEVVEELQKGYIINDRIIRNSMVKVAN